MIKSQQQGIREQRRDSEFYFIIIFLLPFIPHKGSYLTSQNTVISAVGLRMITVLGQLTV